MSETKSLMARAKRYIRSAKLLIEDGDYESAVSRIYYAMFYCTEAALLTRNLSFSSHKAVISSFGQYFVKPGIFPKDMSKSLTKAFEMRQFGDYEFTFVIPKPDAKDMLKEGDAFVKAVARYLKQSAQKS